MTRRGHVLLLTVLVLGAEAVTLARFDLEVTIQGQRQLVARDTRLADAARPLLAVAEKGNLVDVEGKILERGIADEEVLLNGKPASGRTVLREGDEVRVRDGRDRVEPVDEATFEVFGRKSSGAEYQLETARGVVRVVRGRLSKKVSSATFERSERGGGPDAVALTFDDGPHPRHTPRILRILEKYDVPATFFVVGQMAKAYPELIEAERKVGMLIANHSWGHPHRPSFTALSRDRIRYEIRETQEVLEEAGIDASFFRPPGGAYDGRVIELARSYGLRTIIWSLDSRDWKNPPAKKIVDRVVKNVEGGSVILMHDGGPNREATIDALPKIIEGVRKKGLRFVTLS